MPPVTIPVIAMLVVVFGLKTAIFPLWFWLPDTYHTMPPALGGLFARLGLVRVVARLALDNTGGVQEAQHAIGWLRTGGDPVLRALDVELHEARVEDDHRLDRSQ